MEAEQGRDVRIEVLGMHVDKKLFSIWGRGRVERREVNVLKMLLRPSTSREC